MIVNSSQGGGSKDTWVLEDGERRATDAEPADRVLVAAAHARPAARRRAGRRPATAATAVDVLARIAHELYWLGRQLARAEHTARMLDGVFHADLQGRPDDPAGVRLRWDALLTIVLRRAAGGARRRATRCCARSRSTPSTRPRS